MLLIPRLLIASAAGVFSHLGFFIHGEHDEQAPYLFMVFLACYMLLIVSDSGKGLQQAIFNSSLISMAYSLTIWTSMIIYRLFFHRLAHLPGPYMMRVSKFWQVHRNSKSLNYLEMDKLHSDYGTFVRTGPNEMVVFAPEALTALHGPNSRCSKSVWYASMRPEISIHTTREKSDHDKRRRIWDHGFSNAALKMYDGRLQELARELESKIAKSDGGAIDVSSLFYFYAFDAMGSISYGWSFDLMKNGAQSSAVKMLREGLSTVGFLIPVPWLFMTIIRLPYLSRKWRRMLSWAAHQVDQRMKNGAEDRDVMSWVIEAYQKSRRTKLDRLWLNGDAFTIIVAGSGTMGLSLTMIFYHLAKHPEHAAKLRDELKTTRSIDDTNELQSLNHLNAVITETLRLYPGVPAGAPRDTPREGLTIAGKHIPGNVSVIAPCYSIGRLESCFVNPNHFIPERWYSRPEMVRDPNANKPFLLGRYGCVGKNLALMQLRGVVALIVSRYQVSFAPGEDGRRVIEDMRDAFNLKPGRLDLTFEPVH